MRFLIKLLLLIICPLIGYSQSFDLMFSLNNIDCDALNVCYDVQIQSTSSEAFNLAGQNYRIYYDNSNADFVSVTSSLGTDNYTDVDLVQDIGPVDGSSNSTNLGYEATLGFLNYSIDLTDLQNGGVMVDAAGTWFTTSQVCFSVIQAVVDDENVCIELDWAKDGYTNSLATAFNEISQLEAPQNTQPVAAINSPTHDNLDAADGDQSCFFVSCSDTDMPMQYDIRLTREDVDCASHTVCYDVQLKSNDGEDVVLAGQNYRLYYDNSLGDFSSATKLLDDRYATLSLDQDVGPVDASASSSMLGFESTLGFLNYNLDLVDLDNGGVILTGEWTTTSQLCFVLEEEVLLDDNICFEAVWGRDPLTASIATAFVEVSTWTAPQVTEEGVCVEYGDLTSDIENACVHTECQCNPSVPTLSID